MPTYSITTKMEKVKQQIPFNKQQIPVSTFAFFLFFSLTIFELCVSCCYHGQTQCIHLPPMLRPHNSQLRNQNALPIYAQLSTSFQFNFLAFSSFVSIIKCFAVAIHCIFSLFFSGEFI